MRKPVTIKIAGKTYKALPSFAAISAMESEQVRPLRLMRELESGDFSINEVSRATQAVLEANGHEISVDECGEAMLTEESGLQRFVEFISLVVTGAFGAGPEEPLDDDVSDGDAGKTTAST